MEYGIIRKDDLNKLLAFAGKGAVVYAPVETERGVEFRRFDGETEISFQCGNAKLSPKGLFFPQKETLITFSGDILSGITLPEERSIIFGARPCDALALKFLDKIFSDTAGRFPDPYYLKRREKALVITLSCNEPVPTCFCTSVRGDPAGKEGSDIFACELADLILLEGITEKGKAFLTAASSLLGEPVKDHFTRRDENIKRAEAKVSTLNINGLKEKLDSRFEDAAWEPVTNNCLGCGACTYLCPTCHCFDITDETNGRGEGIRIRTWDSCQYPLFTLHASGHNPRVNKKQRMRQRIMHKFSYTVENSQAIFCVGCGRCIRHCPVNLDIREILTTFHTIVTPE
ncbi:MAG: 4Fe-4S dicluster domain-containing protein [Spirochaetota bacterium]